MIDKPTILIIDNSPSMTGALKSILAVVGELKQQFSFIIALPTNVEMSNTSYTAKHVPFLEVQKNWRLILYLPLLLVNTFRLQKIIIKHKVSVIHVNDLYNMCGVLLKVLNPKLILIHHVRLLPESYAKQLYKVWSKLIFKFSDQVICVSKAVFTKLAPSYKKIIVYDSLAPITIGSDKKTKDNQFTFLYIGNFISGKGQDFAIEAYASSNDELKNTQLIFIGGDMGKPRNKMYKLSLKQQVIQKGLSDQIEFIGFESNLDPYYQMADVVINFSESESFSMVCLESLMNGTPVIATKCGGPEEIIEHGVNGLLVKNRDIIEMSHAMVTIYQETELRKTMTIQAKAISNKFSLAVSAARLSNIYNSLC